MRGGESGGGGDVEDGVGRGEEKGGGKRRIVVGMRRAEGIRGGGRS